MTLQEAYYRGKNPQATAEYFNSPEWLIEFQRLSTPEGRKEIEAAAAITDAQRRAVTKPNTPTIPNVKTLSDSEKAAIKKADNVSKIAEGLLLLGVAAGLFFGGRFLWKKFKKR